jgi:ABC-type dipeptide/oligopeptide/nickel transport system ATPase component
MKLIYLIGLPGCGKSTVMKSFMSEYDWKERRVIDLLYTHESGNFRVLGKYEEGEVFSGTDRLSMAVAPKAIEWLSTTPNEIVIGEGDRLNNKAFFEKAKEIGELHIIQLTVSDEERERRYKQRGSNQSDKFIQTVATKCKNISEHFGDHITLFGFEPGNVIVMNHETEDDTKTIVDLIKKLSK